jgi:putative PEP-CTERM system TPR-repeat lipoprotein
MRRPTQKALRASVMLSTLLVIAGLSGCGKSETSASLLADAKQYQQKGDHKAALIQLKNAASKNPEDAEVRYELARLYIDTGDAVSADKEIRKAMSLGTDRARALPLLAKALLLQGKAQEALDASNEGAAQAGPELLATRGDAFAAINDVAKATEAYEAALAAKPGHAAALTGLARLAMVRQDTAAANTYMEQALAANPKDPAVWMFKGAMLRATGKADEALAAYGEVIKLKPDHMNALVERAQIQIDAQKYEAAQADLTAARKAAPNALIVKHAQALLYFKQNKFAEAKESLQQVSKLAPDFMPAVLLSGAVDLNLGAYQQAEQSLKRYVERFPDNAYARKLLAQTMLHSARPGDAAAMLAPLLKEDSQDGQLMALAGMSAAQSNDPAKATAYFQRASVLDPKSATIRTSLGLAKLGSGNTEAGISELEKAVELNPASEEAVMALLRAQMSLKQYDRALATAAKAEKQFANSVHLHNLKGGAYIAKGDIANARLSFDRAAVLKPSEFSPVMNLAQLDMQQKNPAAAQKRIEAFLEKNKKHVNAMFALSELAGAQGQKPQATAWLEKAATENPESAAAAIRLGANYLANGQNEKALTLARKARAVAPDNNELADLLGQAQIANKDYGAALETYSALAQAAPKSAAAHMRLARAHILLKDNTAAANDLKRAVAVQPDYLPARLAQVELAARFGKPEDALAMARQMQSQFAKSPVGYVVEGDVHQAMGRPAQAVPAYEKAFALAKSPALVVKLADSLRRRGKAKEAETRLTQWLKANPTDNTAQTYLAEMHLANKQFKPAATQYEEMLKRQPDNPALLNNLAWAYQQGKDPRALATAERAAKLAPDNPAVLDTLGWLLAEQGDTGRALPLLKKAVGAAPEARDTRYHLAAALYKSGDKSSARKELEKLLVDNKPFAAAEDAKALMKLL